MSLIKYLFTALKISLWIMEQNFLSGYICSMDMKGLSTSWFSILYWKVDISWFLFPPSKDIYGLWTHQKSSRMWLLVPMSSSQSKECFCAEDGERLEENKEVIHHPVILGIHAVLRKNLPAILSELSFPWNLLCKVMEGEVILFIGELFSSSTSRSAHPLSHRH